MAVTAKFTTLGTALDMTDTDVNPDAAPTATPRQGGFILRNRINFGNVSVANKTMWTVSDATPATDTTVPLKLLEVPERVYVKDLTVFAVKDQDPPALFINGAQASNADINDSDLDTMTMGFGATRNKKPTSDASYAAASHLVTLTTVNGEQKAGIGTVAGDVFGNMKIIGAASDPLNPEVASQPNLLFVDPFQKIDSSLGNPLEPMGTAKVVRNQGADFTADAAAAETLIQQEDGEYFPYGGYVHMKLGPWNTSMASKISDATGYYSSTTAAVVYPTGVWEVQANCMYVPE